MRSISVADAAAEMGVSESLIRSLLYRGEITGYRAGRAVRVFVESIEDYQRRRAYSAAPPAIPPRKKALRKSTGYTDALRRLNHLLA